MPDSVLFDRYELIEPAGRGGSAEVWRARDRETGDTVAVKRLHPVVFSDAAARQRLEREFNALQRLDEPHIVRVRDLRIEDREAAIILDYVDGETLRDRLAGLRTNRERMPIGEAVAVVDDVAAALSAAHEAGLVHRDVTPANILVGTDGAARLTDFGIAYATDDATAVTATGTVLGTMRYLAPEQLRGEPATPATDIHGLAAVAYEAIAGRPAYDAATPVALVEAQRAGPAPIDGVPAGVEQAVRTGLDTDPARRPKDVRAFATALAAAATSSGAYDATIAVAVPPVVDDVGVASPSRAAAAGLPMAAAALPASSDSDGAVGSARASAAPRPVKDGRRPVPGPVVAAIGLVLAVGLVAAASGLDRLPTGGASAGESARPSRPAATARPTPAPTKAPKADAGGGGGEDHGHGKEHKEKGRGG